MTEKLKRRYVWASLWSVGGAIPAILLCVAPTHAQPAGSAPRPASAWPFYQASRPGTLTYQPAYQPPVYQAPARSSVGSSWNGAQNGGPLHQSQEYPYYFFGSHIYPYSRSYLYPYNFNDSTTVPSIDTGSGSGWQITEDNPPDKPRRYNPPVAPAVPLAAPASVEIVLPDAQAEVIFNGVRTKTKGTDRTYKTPDLAPGRSYFYDVTASWTQDGDRVTQRRLLKVTPGEHALVDFTR